MKNKTKSFIALVLVLLLSVFPIVGCSKKTETKTTEAPAVEATPAQTTAAPAAEETPAPTTAAPAADANAAPAPNEEDAAGFKEYDLGEAQTAEPYLSVAGVYFQPVDMEPAGNSLSKKDADCHIEADISALEGNGLGYGAGDFVPWLNVKALIQKQGSDKVQEVVCMPMNASDGPHYGNNIKFEEGTGVYDIKFEISAPGNEYLLHVDAETGVPGRFWTEPIVVEFKNFEWEGAAGRW